MTSSYLFSLSSVAYPRADLSIPSFYAIQAGRPATIDCQIMPGKLSQYYSVTWLNGNLTIAKSNPHSVHAGYQLHDNFSLTINYIQPSESSTNYQCSVTIDDPQISGTINIVYSQLGSITVIVYGKSLSGCISIYAQTHILFQRLRFIRVMTVLCYFCMLFKIFFV